MSDRVIRWKYPNNKKQGCITTRRFLIFISCLVLLGTVPLLCLAIFDPYKGYHSIFYCAYNAIHCVFYIGLFYGALKYNDRALGYCEKFLIFSMILLFVMFCFAPASSASFAASGYDKVISNEGAVGKSEIAETIWDPKNTARTQYWFGFFVGEMVVFLHIFYASYLYSVYDMIKRFRKYMAARKVIEGNESLA